MRESGIKAPVFHNDAYIAGLYSDVVDIYACDIYPYINPSKSWKESTFAFDTLDNLEDVVREFNNSSPLFVAEMQAGWYDKWLGAGYENNKKRFRIQSYKHYDKDRYCKRGDYFQPLYDGWRYKYFGYGGG